MDDDERRGVRADFGDAVNMTHRQLTDWLGTEQSRSVGDRRGSDESTGHAMGRRIVDLLQKKAGELTDDDLAGMRKVVGYVHRHLAQRPSGDVQDTRWRYSLMNWGHDPVA